MAELSIVRRSLEYPSWFLFISHSLQEKARELCFALPPHSLYFFGGCVATVIDGSPNLIYLGLPETGNRCGLRARLRPHLEVGWTASLDREHIDKAHGYRPEIRSFTT